MKTTNATKNPEEQSKIRDRGWHWWYGVGNDRDGEGRPTQFPQWWVVLCWEFKGEGYASSACWLSPMKQSDMDSGQWGDDISNGQAH